MQCDKARRRTASYLILIYYRINIIARIDIIVQMKDAIGQEKRNVLHQFLPISMQRTTAPWCRLRTCL